MPTERTVTEQYDGTSTVDGALLHFDTAESGSQAGGCSTAQGFYA